jgi:hypothetical protein
MREVKGLKSLLLVPFHCVTQITRLYDSSIQVGYICTLFLAFFLTFFDIPRYFVVFFRLSTFSL